MVRRWGNVKARRMERDRQLKAMSDQALAAEVEWHTQAEWNQNKLLEHVKDHQRDYALFFGQPVGPKEIEETSKLVMQSWDRLFTGLDRLGRVSYTFSSNWEPAQARVFVVVSGVSRIRTLIPSQQFGRYLGRHLELVEVTKRVRDAGG